MNEIKELNVKKGGLGAMMAGGNPQEERQTDDFYATPPEATQSLLAAYGPMMDHGATVHEPCCGDGLLAKQLEMDGFTVIGTDINPRGYGTAADIFNLSRALGDIVITNPPFTEAEKIIRHVLDVWQSPILILLLKSTFFHADGRISLFDKHRPARVYMLPWRLDFLGKGRPTMECSWFVWDRYNPSLDGYPSYRIAPNFNPKKRANKKLSLVGSSLNRGLTDLIK